MTNTMNIRRITLTALMAALVVVLTTLPRVPIPATGGYGHLGDAGITFAALAFGPWVAMLAGGIGTALADLMGYPQWAIFSLIIHGAQGFVMGMMVKKGVHITNAVLAVVVGTAIVVAGYFVAGIILVGAGEAVKELVFNTLQGASGGVVGALLYFAVRQAYPPLTRYEV